MTDSFFFVCGDLLLYSEMMNEKINKIVIIDMRYHFFSVVVVGVYTKEIHKRQNCLRIFTFQQFHNL